MSWWEDDFAAPWPTDVADLVAVRRDLHAHPELGFTEIRTAARIIHALNALGWSTRFGVDVADASRAPGLPDNAELEAARQRAISQGVPVALANRLARGHTAVIAELSGDWPGPVIAIRIDMDALPIVEDASEGHLPTRKGFASRNPASMHACGHDGHVAMGLALASLLAARKFAGTVRLIFQPAEEGVRGAALLADAGAVDGVDVMLAFHLGFGLPTGQIAASATAVHATNKFRAIFTGESAHASKAPERGRHALLAAATAAIHLHGLPRVAGATTRVNVGRLMSGTVPNIVPDRAEMLFETRASTLDAARLLADLAERVVSAAGDMYSVDVVVEQTGHATVSHTDPAVADVVAASAEAAGLVVLATHPLDASDDATLLMRAVQDAGGIAGYFIIGSTSPGPPHSPTMDLDEKALQNGVRVLEGMLSTSHPSWVCA